MEDKRQFEMQESEQLAALPGTAQLRKVTSYMTGTQLIELASEFARVADDKKLWSLLSRVYADGKILEQISDEDMPRVKGVVDAIMATGMAAEYKLQLFTSFKLPKELLPSDEDIVLLASSCKKKRINILAYFIVDYNLETLLYKDVITQRDVFKIVAKKIGTKRLVALYQYIITSENKEFITGAARMLASEKVRVTYDSSIDVKGLVELIFSSKEVFFTTKLLLCMALNIPKNMLPYGRDLDKNIVISINYEERITKDFVKFYDLRFDCSDRAMCTYYLNNKKTTKERVLVQKFASHLVRIEDEEEKRRLVRKAFRRGGAFRMYAGCMQDGYVDEDKQRRFHCTEDDIQWIKSLPGLK